MHADWDCPSTWMTHTMITCMARVYPAHNSPFFSVMDSSACVITPLNLCSSAKGASPVKWRQRVAQKASATGAGRQTTQKGGDTTGSYLLYQNTCWTWTRPEWRCHSETHNYATAAEDRVQQHEEYLLMNIVFCYYCCTLCLCYFYWMMIFETSLHWNNYILLMNVNVLSLC